MPTIRLGRTNLVVNKNGFGALPIQRVTLEEAKPILRKAYENGINFFDTARSYSDSEEKLGYALSNVRDEIIIATKTPSTTVEGFWKDLNTSLSLLKCDHVDILQFHNPSFVPKPEDGTGLYEAMLEARDKGMIRFIGFTNHRLHLAEEAVNSGLYDTLQFPFSYLASEKEKALVALCAEKDVGFICMKALSGGLITRADAAYAYLAEYPVLPIWGIQREKELDDFLACGQNPPAMTDEIKAHIARERKELTGDFCRGCGYCMPCPVNIEINNAARMSLMLRRAPKKAWLSETWQKKMALIDDCLECGQCAAKCPYGLDTPNLLKKNWEDYKTFLK